MTLSDCILATNVSQEDSQATMKATGMYDVKESGTLADFLVIRNPEQQKTKKRKPAKLSQLDDDWVVVTDELPTCK
ncbi:unnamed protein product, partial [Mesorhabditis spiculigera]